MCDGWLDIGDESARSRTRSGAARSSQGRRPQQTREPAGTQARCGYTMQSIKTDRRMRIPCSCPCALAALHARGVRWRGSARLGAALLGAAARLARRAHSDSPRPLPLKRSRTHSLLAVDARSAMVSFLPSYSWWPLLRGSSVRMYTTVQHIGATFSGGGKDQHCCQQLVGFWPQMQHHDPDR